MAPRTCHHTCKGEILKTRQLYRIGDDVDEDGSLTVVENTIDGYHKHGTLQMPKPTLASKAVERFALSGDAVSDARPCAAVSKVSLNA